MFFSATPELLHLLESYIASSRLCHNLQQKANFESLQKQIYIYSQVP